MCKDLPKDAWLEFQDGGFQLHGVGRWAQYAEDPAASDGSAARMPANHRQWAVQCPLPEGLPAGQKWRCYVAARCDVKAQQGNGIQMGIYDHKARKGVVSRTIPIDQVAAKDYRVIDLGIHQLTADMWFWVAPCQNPDVVKAVYVDRMFIIRAK